MNEEIINKANKLHGLLNNDPRVIHLNDCEKIMANNSEAMALAYKKNVAADEYNDAINHYGEFSKESEECLKKLHEAKFELDNLKVVKDYMKAYKEVRLLLKDINDILFKDFNNLCEKKICE